MGSVNAVHVLVCLSAIQHVVATPQLSKYGECFILHVRSIHGVALIGGNCEPCVLDSGRRGARPTCEWVPSVAPRCLIGTFSDEPFRTFNFWVTKEVQLISKCEFAYQSFLAIWKTLVFVV